MNTVYCKNCKEEKQLIWDDATYKRNQRVNLEDWDYQDIGDWLEWEDSNYYCLDCNNKFDEEAIKKIDSMI